MNKKALIIVTSLLIAVIAGVWSLSYFLSFKTVSFTIIPDGVNVIIHNQDRNEIARFSQDGSIRLQAGDYFAIPDHDNYSSASTPFTVEDQDITVSVDPSYSLERLEELLEADEQTITRIIRDAYPDTIDDFAIQPGKLYQKGEWYATTLEQNPLPGGQQGDVYRVVLHKVDNQWQIVAGPEIVLSAQKYTDVPYDILKDINSNETREN
jgi:hypothetical protein